MTRSRKDFLDMRNTIRFATSFEAELIEGADRRRVVVGDISAGGAMLRDTHPPKAGSEIGLRAAGLNITAIVKWQRQGLCGLQFADKVDPLAVVRDNLPYFRDFRTRLGDPSLPICIFQSSPFTECR